MRSVPSFPRGTLSQGAMGGEVDHAVEFQVQEFADAHAGRSQHDQPRAGEGVVKDCDGSHEVTVDIRGETARDRLRQAGQIGQEDQPLVG